MDAPALLGPGEGESIRRGFDIKTGRPELVLVEAIYAPGQAGPAPHLHRHHADAFWVLGGELLVQIGPELEPRALPAGAFALVPPQVLHTFRNPGPERAHFLNVHAPGLGFEVYLRSGFKAPFDQHYMPAGGSPGDGAIVLGPGEGEARDGAALKARGGSLEVVELELSPGFAGDERTSENGVDSFYVLDGVLTLALGDEAFTAPAGGCAVVAAGHVHALSNAGHDPVRLLHLKTPAV